MNRSPGRMRPLGYIRRSNCSPGSRMLSLSAEERGIIPVLLLMVQDEGDKGGLFEKWTVPLFREDITSISRKLISMDPISPMIIRTPVRSMRTGRSDLLDIVLRGGVSCKRTPSTVGLV